MVLLKVKMTVALTVGPSKILRSEMDSTVANYPTLNFSDFYSYQKYIGCHILNPLAHFSEHVH